MLEFQVNRITTCLVREIMARKFSRSFTNEKSKVNMGEKIDGFLREKITRNDTKTKKILLISLNVVYRNHFLERFSSLNQTDKLKTCLETDWGEHSDKQKLNTPPYQRHGAFSLFENVNKERRGVYRKAFYNFTVHHWYPRSSSDKTSTRTRDRLWTGSDF